MQVTKDIVFDLLPGYLAGESSEDTCSAVEEFLVGDAELRAMVASAGGWASPPTPEVPAGIEVRSLERTRELLRRKNFWLGFALIFSFGAVLLRPLWLADLVMAAGFCGWAPFLAACRGLRATGIEGRGRMARMVWAQVGVGLGLAAGHLLHAQTGLWWTQYFPMVVSSSAAMWMGEKLRRIPTMEEINKPTSLFH